MTGIEKYSRLKERRISLREAVPLAKPFAVLFEPASICNFRCECCFHSDPSFVSFRPKGRMDFGDFKKIANDLAAWDGERVKVIRLIGFGEPFLNPDTPRMVRYLKELGVAERIEITTNASLLTAAVSRQLVEAGLDYLRCSIYSVNQARHSHLTRNTMSIEAIRNNIAALRGLRDSAGAVKPFIYVKMLESGDQSEDEAFLSRYSSVADECALEKKHQWLSGPTEPGRKPRSVCPQPFKMLSILFSGDVILCDPDWQKNTCVGNALSQKISDIWSGERTRQFWRMQLENRRHENASCRVCTFLVDEYAIDDLDGVSPKVLGEG